MKPIMWTFTRKEVNPLDLKVSDIDLEDVAHHLSCINRFNGAVRTPISVAQHAVFVSLLLMGTGYELHGLAHDNAEAYVGDVTKWLKHSEEMTAFRAAEDRAQAVCDEAFGIVWDDTAREVVEWADRVMVRFEGRQGFGPTFAINHPRYPPLTTRELTMVGAWEPWPWYYAKAMFRTSFKTLLERRERGELEAVTGLDLARVLGAGA